MGPARCPHALVKAVLWCPGLQCMQVQQSCHPRTEHHPAIHWPARRWAGAGALIAVELVDSNSGTVCKLRCRGHVVPPWPTLLFLEKGVLICMPMAATGCLYAAHCTALYC